MSDLLAYGRAGKKKAPLPGDAHEFWDTQPVPKTDEKVTDFGPLEVKTLADVPPEPYPVASILEWFTPDVHKESDLTQIYSLLNENYVEDDDSIFRFNYAPAFLKWALTPPGYFPEWHVGVRTKKDKTLMAFISGVPANIRLGDDSKRICEINFLCVHKRLRSKRMAPILIKEVTRRVNLRDIWQAVYTAGIELPKAFATAQYFHRSLNPAKLIAIGFSRLPPKYEKLRDPMGGITRAYALPEKTQCAGIRPMKKEDAPAVLELLKAYLAPYKVAPAFDVEECCHWLMPTGDFIYSYVIENPKTKLITDFVSFYSLPSTVIGNDKYQDLRAAYAYYYVSNTYTPTQLMRDALVLAKSLGFDVFNCLHMMANESFLSELKFGQGDGYLRYYLFNWKFPTLKSNELGLVML